MLYYWLDKLDKVAKIFFVFKSKTSHPITISPNIQSGEPVFTDTCLHKYKSSYKKSFWLFKCRTLIKQDTH